MLFVVLETSLEDPVSDKQFGGKNCSFSTNIKYWEFQGHSH